MTITYAQALATARQLPREDRARLVAVLSTELETPKETETSNDAWATMARLRQEFAQMTYEKSPAEILDEDRRVRDSALAGIGDVHA